MREDQSVPGDGETGGGQVAAHFLPGDGVLGPGTLTPQLGVAALGRENISE